MRAIRRFTVRTVLPAELAPLGELALNLRWSWHPDSQELFGSVDRSLYPRLPDFVALARELDPEGKFRNAFLERNVFAG